MPVFDVAVQGSSGWLKARLGHLTASRMNDAMDFTKKGEPSEKRRKYQFEMLAERMSDRCIEKYVTNAMQHGIDAEPLARQRYEEVTGNLVQQVGFATHDTIPFFGASSDGLVGTEGMIEIKCCETPNHLTIVLGQVVPSQYKLQMTAQCIVLNRKWCDFVAFDPRIPDPAQMFVKRFVPTEKELADVEAGARLFLMEVERLFDMLTTGEVALDEEINAAA